MIDSMNLIRPEWKDVDRIELRILLDERVGGRASTPVGGRIRTISTFHFGASRAASYSSSKTSRLLGFALVLPSTQFNGRAFAPKLTRS